MAKSLKFLPLILFSLLIVGLGYLFWRVGTNILASTPTPISSITPLPAPIHTPTPTPTATPTPTSTATPTPTPTATPTPTPFETTLIPTPTPAITIVIPVSLRVRQRQNLASAVVAWLPEGAEVTILGRNVGANWLNIRVPNGQVGWVKAGAVNAAEQGVAVADLSLVLSPPTPTPPGAPGNSETPEPTETPPPEGQIILESPLSQADQFFADIEFEWRWEGADLPPEFGFEVLIWREGEDISSAHNAVVDNREGHISRIDDNHYHLILDVTYAPGVRDRQGVYLWTVKLIRVAPKYDDNFEEGQILADPEEFFFDS